MLIIPAIDIKDGQCVRLLQGEMNSATVFSDNAGETAGKWLEMGARRLHVEISMAPSRASPEMRTW